MENVGSSEKWVWINHIIAALQEHLDSVIRKRTGLKNIDCGMKCFVSDENFLKCSYKHWRNGFLISGHQNNLWSILQLEKKPFKKWSKMLSL